MRLSVLIAAAALIAAGPAAAQTWSGYDGGYGHARVRSNAVPSTFDWRSQQDRPGDYRCDAFWDAGRSDCDARWRDQRGGTSYGYRGAAYDHDGRYGYGGYGGYGHARYRSYGYGGGHGGYANPTTAYYGAYGRPDLVSGGGYSAGYGSSYGGGVRDPRRVDQCRAAYRSYDPASGYYRTYSGRLVFCG